MNETEPTLTLRDIANLAGVQREVVSNWRRRPRVRGMEIPFPDPAPGTGATERFRRDDIVDWLARTGRGKNAEHRLDAPAMSVPAGASLEDLVTLLCLNSRTTTDLTGSSATDLERLAFGADPDDAFLLTEVRQLAVTGEALRFVDDLMEASLGLRDALRRLEEGSAGRAQGRRELTDEAEAIVHAVVRAGALHLDADGVPVVFTGGPPGLGLAVAAGSRQLVLSGDGPADRALRRRALLHELDLADRADGPLLRVLSVLGLETDAALDRVDNLLLDLGPREVAVVIGSAGALCERLRGEAERVRATMLRPGRLVAAVRLPRGLWREAHRQALGLWICAGSQTTNRLMIADLGACALSDLSVEDLAADVSGALSDDDTRGFRYLRATDLSLVLAGSPVVPPGARAPRWRVSPDNHLGRIRAAALVTAQPLDPFDVLVTASPGVIVLKQRSLGELHDEGVATVYRRSRIDRAHADPNGTVPVLTADGTMDDIALDPFDAERRYPRAQRTEPGDVVFDDGPSPRARVEEHGGSLVASPSRILRLDPKAGIGPHTLAAIINHQTATGEWRGWSVPLLDAADAATLEAALSEAGRYSEALRRREAALHDLITALIDGVAAGALSVAPTENPRKDGR